MWNRSGQLLSAVQTPPVVINNSSHIFFIILLEAPRNFWKSWVISCCSIPTMKTEYTTLWTELTLGHWQGYGFQQCVDIEFLMIATHICSQSISMTTMGARPQCPQFQAVTWKCLEHLENVFAYDAKIALFDAIFLLLDVRWSSEVNTSQEGSTDPSAARLATSAQHTKNKLMFKSSKNTQFFCIRLRGNIQYCWKPGAAQ